MATQKNATKSPPIAQAAVVEVEEDRREDQKGLLAEALAVVVLAVAVPAPGSDRYRNHEVQQNNKDNRNN